MQRTAHTYRLGCSRSRTCSAYHCAASSRLHRSAARRVLRGCLPKRTASVQENVPHDRDTRKWFYQDVSDAVLAGLQQGRSRLRVRCTIPETNPEMDVFRIGTLLELVREVAWHLARDGATVKVCVQGSMGEGVFQGLPLSLSGVRKIMGMMDWGDIAEFVRFGEVGSQEVDDSSFFVLVAPQNVVGTTIMTNLIDMIEAAEAAGKAMVLINPVLKDIPSSSGVMGVRGRKERKAFEDTFEWAYHFRLLYQSSALMYPIMGCLRYSRADEQWRVYRRQAPRKQQESYDLVGTFAEEPVGAALNNCFKDKPAEPRDPNVPSWKYL